MSTFSWDLPALPAAFTGETAQEQSEIDRLFGVDLHYDIASTHGPDLVVTPAGDWRTTRGLECLRQSLIRRFLTKPGTWRTLPRYGAGAGDFVKLPGNSANRAKLLARLKEQAMLDPRVTAVSDASAEWRSGGVLVVSVTVVPRGQTGPFTVAAEVR